MPLGQDRMCFWPAGPSSGTTGSHPQELAEPTSWLAPDPCSLSLHGLPQGNFVFSSLACNPSGDRGPGQTKFRVIHRLLEGNAHKSLC
jgi:hypothetical protein